MSFQLDFDGVSEHGTNVALSLNDNDGDVGIIDRDSSNRMEDNSESLQRTTFYHSIEEMFEYFNSMADSTFSNDKKEALSIIKDRLNNDTDDGNQFIPIDLLQKTNVVKEMILLIQGRIRPDTDRVRTSGNNLLKKWLKATNSSRLFMFINKNALVRIAAGPPYGMKLRSSETYDVLIEKLVHLENKRNETNNNPVSSAQTRSMEEEIMKALLERSFMRPLKGIAKEHCAMGHKLELPIAIDWMNDVHEKKLFHGYHFKILSLIKAGLVAKKGYPWVKDSIDFIASIYNEESSEVEIWGIEIKSRQTIATLNKEKEHIRKLKRRKYEIIDSKDVFSHIKSVEESWQLMHHAYTYGFEKVALIIGGNDGKVVSGTVVRYGNEIHSSYGEVLNELKRIALFYAYDDGTQDIANLVIPREVTNVAEKIPTIGGTETLYGALKPCKVLFDDTSILPRPTIRRIIPSTHAKWNKSKGGSDTITKIVDDCYLHPPRNYTNFESVAVGRCISNLHAATHKLNQIYTSNLDDNSNKQTIEHYRNANSHRLPFKRYLRQIHLVFKKEAENFDSLGDQQRSCSATLSDESTRKRPRRATFMDTGTIPTKLEFTSPKTFDTTQRYKKKRISQGEVPQHIQDRTQNCIGYPVEVLSNDEKRDKDKSELAKKEGKDTYKVDARRKCFVCDKKTKWYCIGCKLFFCLTNKDDSNLLYFEEKQSTDASAPTVTKVFRNSYFHIKHEAAMKQMFPHCQPCATTNSKK